MSKSKLNTLRRQLQKLLQTRRSVRLGSAWSAILISLIAVLLSVFAIDLLFELSVLQRLIVFTIAVTIFYWSTVRFSLPLFGIHETELEMALLVEHQHGIESDLVSALQFESPEASQWGSENLETAVIDYVADLGTGIDVFAGLNTRSFKKRLSTMGVALFIAVVLGLIYPSTLTVFFQRLLLGNQHYPTSTQITELDVSGFTIDLVRPSQSIVNIGYGQPLEFNLQAAGVIPEQGRILLTNSQGKETEILLTPDESSTENRFTAELPRLLAPIRYQVFLGDAWTDPAPVQVISLPIIEATIQVTPPQYAAAEEAEVVSTNLQASVLEGSRIQLKAQSSKKLTEAYLLIQTDEEPIKVSLEASDSENKNWTLPNKTPPFDSISGPVRFELHVLDQDQLKSQFPLRGYLRIKADRGPQVSGAFVHKVTLPNAQPLLDYRVDDDHGISQLRLNVQIERDSVVSDTRYYEILKDLPLHKAKLPLIGQFQLNLSELQLNKNDRLRMRLEATDYRGEIEGLTTLSEPLVLDISDESGVLAAISEADEKSEEQITDIIKRQLGIGETK
ncbi:MAG: hypothetical protein COA78_23395 [Blastopirellula sp.]|nr:MAG: hypothetical protein COA78_23395 [Blastopirellula sp.]